MIWVLLFIPVMVMVFASTVNLTFGVTQSDIKVQRSLERAVKVAAMQVVDESQADGTIRIDYDKSHQVFRETLAKNLLLAIDDLQPSQHSTLAETPYYYFIVYNGDDKYHPENVTGRYYIHRPGVHGDGTFDSGMYSLENRPRTFHVAMESSRPVIRAGSGGEFTVTIKNPGVIAAVKMESKTVAGMGELSPVRWASATIFCKNKEVCD